MLARLKARLARADRARVTELEQRLDHERLYPQQWANRRIRDRFGSEVVEGPFAGLAYPDFGITDVDLFAAKILGSYECELHAVLEAAIARRPTRVVNVGAADGYYAIGLARRLPGATVVAFEADARQRGLLAQTARHNGVDVEIRGTCGAAELRETVSPDTFLVCDCEGCERELLDPGAVPALARADLLVETHDLISPGITRLLRQRFQRTHAIEEIPTAPRHPKDFPQLSFLPLVTQQLAVSELRQGPMTWLALTLR